jgi:hypothetical protein
MSRKDDPAIKAALLYLRSVNIQNPEYAEIKRILEEGANGCYVKSSMNERQYLLIKLIEECAEVAQRATKALTFGLYEKQAQGPSETKTGAAELNNNERLAQEFDDLIAVSEMLNEHLAIRLSTRDERAKEAKKDKIRKYMAYSREIGTLE